MSAFRFHTTILFFSLLFLASCSEDETPAASSETRFSISVKSPGVPTDPSGDNEKINTWWIALVSSNGTVRAILERPAGLTAAVEEETINAEIPTGRYTAYAFANITKDELQSKTGITFTTGQAAPTDAQLSSAAWNMPNNSYKDQNIPMSGRQEITITGHVNESFAIEVVRMLAKIEFAFSNNASKDITVNSVSFSPLNTGNIPLLPNYSTLEGAPVLLPDNGTEAITLNFSGDNAITLAAGANETKTEHFYARESLVQSQATGHFLVSVNISREGSSTNQLYSLTEQLTYINRNDYIRIPISFTDYLLDFDVLFYPPIGGYPAVINEKKDNEYYIKFGTQGKFVINPLIREASDGSAYLQPGQYTINIAVNQDGGIFTTYPALDENTGEITGELNSSTGTAEVKATISINNGTTTYQYERLIYIIRE